MTGPTVSATRPARLVIVAGTGTEIGKTWVSARVLEALRADGHSVAARKPAQSFDEAATEPTDADVLAAASDTDPHAVCPKHRWYPIPMAPPMAAVMLGQPAPKLAVLVEELRWPAPPVAVGIVEPAGGVRSPLAIDGDTVALAAALEPDAIVLVADAGLGTINLVRLSATALARWPLLVFLNRFDDEDDLHVANRDWLASVDRMAVATNVADITRFALR